MTAEEWVVLVGYRKANRLFIEYGGHSVHIPKFPHKDHPLAKLLGLECLEVLSDKYPSELVWVPRMNAVLEDFKKVFGLPAKTRYRKGIWACPLQKTMFE
jgi:hypothetical protein